MTLSLLVLLAAVVVAGVIAWNCARKYLDHRAWLRQLEDMPPPSESELYSRYEFKPLPAEAPKPEPPKPLAQRPITAVHPVRPRVKVAKKHDKAYPPKRK